MLRTEGGQGQVEREFPRLARWRLPTLYEKMIKLKLSGIEVYCTNSVMLLLVKNMLCSKLHCQKVLV